MRSLTGRTALAFAALSALIVVVMSIVVYRSSVDQRAGRLRALAAQQAHSAATIYAATGALVGAATINDPSAPASLRAAVRAGHGGTALVSSTGTLTAWAGVPLGTGDDDGVYVRDPGAEDLHALHALRTTLIISSAAIVIAGALGGILVASRLSRQLRRAADGARAIAQGALETRIRARGSDEVSALSDAVDAMADALSARIERERRFNADVAHELRTPVTGLLAASALLPEGDEVSDLVRGRAAHLHHLVEDLLEISRLESGYETADLRPLDAGRFAAELARRYDGVQVAGTLELNTDPRRLERVMTNLLENALAHGAAPVRVELSADEITVTDSGPGFPATDPAHPLLERHITHAEFGHGLGLAIAEAQARVLGAELILENPPGGGARVRLRWVS